MRVLKKADEIKIYYKDRKAILDFFEDYPDKDIILEIPHGLQERHIEWKDYSAYAEMKSNFYFCLGNLELAKKCKEYNIKFYWMYPIANWYELEAVVNCGVSQAYITAPLFFDLRAVKKKYPELAVRVEVNSANEELIPNQDGLCGSWIRPEDTELYEPYVTTFDFKSEELKQEAALLDIYQKKEWPGNLNLLIRGLNFDVDNRILPPDFVEARIRCRQRCKERDRDCNLCYTAFGLAKTVRDEYYRRLLDKEKEDETIDE